MTNAPVRYIVLHYSATYADQDLGVEDIRSYLPNLMLISQRTPRTKPKNTNAEPCESQIPLC